jgi:hypothetical protein
MFSSNSRVYLSFRLSFRQGSAHGFSRSNVSTSARLLACARDSKRFFELVEPPCRGRLLQSPQSRCVPSIWQSSSRISPE